MAAASLTLRAVARAVIPVAARCVRARAAAPCRTQAWYSCTPAARAADDATAPPDAAALHAHMLTKLQSALSPSVCRVEDVSGGCGSFFQLFIVSPQFEGLSLMKQHRLVNSIIGSEIGRMHGLTLRTMSPSQHAAAVANK